MFGLWADTPSGFVEDVLGESLWSKQRQLLDAMPRHKRVAVRAGFGVGKTHIAARAGLWFVLTTPPGIGLCVTTATRFWQVQRQLWPHIRRCVARAKLPGSCDTVQYKIPDACGNEVVAAYGFSAPAGDEAAMQGIHAARLLLVVDEAGGIARSIGSGTNNLLTGDARMLAIGNPATDDPRSWFEQLCEEGDDPEHPGTITIPIAALDSPAITGERVPYCLDCPAGVPKHPLSQHMPDQEWVDRTIGEYGPEHPYVIAKVYAKFPQGGANRPLPVAWIDTAADQPDPEPDGREWLRLCDLGLEGETAEHTVRRGAWVRLGVDVAADGGDEVTVYRVVGDALEQRHASSGPQNLNQVNVAGRILAEVLAAERLAKALGTRAAVRVKIDRNGLGPGVVSILEKWGEEGRHGAQIVGVMVSENIDPDREDPGQQMRPHRKRDEMWLAAPSLLQPGPANGRGVPGPPRLRLRVDHKCLVQLGSPTISTSSTGQVVVESKKAMRARGVGSPDRADGALLALYEPLRPTQLMGW